MSKSKSGFTETHREDTENTKKRFFYSPRDEAERMDSTGFQEQERFHRGTQRRHREHQEEIFFIARGMKRKEWIRRDLKSKSGFTDAHREDTENTKKRFFYSTLDEAERKELLTTEGTENTEKNFFYSPRDEAERKVLLTTESKEGTEKTKSSA